MSLSSLWNRLFTARRQPSGKRSALRLEELEDRLVPSYTILDLGSGFLGNSINNTGLIAGTATANTHATLWNEGTLIDLGTLGGATSSGNGINDLGQVVGMARTAAGTDHAFLITPEDTNQDGTPDRWFRDNDANGINDLMRDLGTLGGTNSTAYDVNNLGQVVGDSRVTLSTSSSVHAFVWDSTGGMRDLGTFGGPNSTARSINALGQVVGQAFTGSARRPFLWTSSGGLQDLGVPANETSSGATDINDSGQVVGYIGHYQPSISMGYYVFSASMWDNGMRTTLPYGISSKNLAGIVLNINNSGQIVGNGYLFEDGIATKLEGEIDPDLGWKISATRDINDAGLILGTGYHNGVLSHFVLTPDAAPSPPKLVVRDVTVSEGNSTASFVVSLSVPSNETVTVNYSTAGASAVEGTDFTRTAGALTFAPGETEKTIQVQINGDTRDEEDEAFYMNLSGVTNAWIADGQALGFIQDDDPPPSMSISDVSLVEGRSGITSFVFTVTLSAVSDRGVSVYYSTADGTAKASDNDYVAAPSGYLIFAPGETTKTIVIQVKGDTKIESNETFFVNLSSAWNATLADAQAVGTILSDDLKKR